MSPYLLGASNIMILRFEIENILPVGQVKCFFRREAVYGCETQRKPWLPRMAPFNYLEGKVQNQVMVGLTCSLGGGAGLRGLMEGHFWRRISEGDMEGGTTVSER